MNIKSLEMNLTQRLEREARIARKAMREADITEEKSGYDIDASLDRRYAEGFLEGIEWALKLASGEASNAN